MPFNSSSSLERIIADIVALHNFQLPRLLAYLPTSVGPRRYPRNTLKSGGFSFFSLFQLFCQTRAFHFSFQSSAPRFTICAL